MARGGCAVGYLLSGSPQQVGQRLFHDDLFVAAAFVNRLNNDLIHHPSEPEFVEKDDLILMHGNLLKPFSAIDPAATGALILISPLASKSLVRIRPEMGTSTQIKAVAYDSDTDTENMP
jgi:hypothetical protein